MLYYNALTLEFSKELDDDTGEQLMRKSWAWITKKRQKKQAKYDLGQIYR